MSFWKALTARWGSGAGEHDEVRIDASTNTLQTIDYSHHEIHAGSHFTYTEYDGDLDNLAVIEILITTPDTTKWAHMIAAITGALSTTVEFYETCTHTAGAAKTAYNNNRNSATANTTTLAVSNDDNADGTPIYSVQFGISTGGGASGVSGGGSLRADGEYMLKQNTKYLLRVTSNADNNVVSVMLGWYEHTDKN